LNDVSRAGIKPLKMKKNLSFLRRKFQVFIISVVFLFFLNSQSHSQWIPLNDAPETNCSVTVSEFTVGTGNGVVIFLTSTSGNVYYNTFNILNDIPVPTSSWQLATFSGAVPRDWFDSPVTLTTMNGELYVFGRIRKFGNPAFNKNLPVNKIFWAHTTDGQNHWTDWTPLPSGGTTDASMSAVTWNESIYLFSKSVADGKIYQNIFFNNTWSGWSVIGGSTIFTQGLSATIAANRLYLFGTSNDHIAMKNSATIKTNHKTVWSIWEPLSDGGEKFYSTLTVANDADQTLRLFGFKYNNVQHGIGILENDYDIPIPNIKSKSLNKWIGWHTLEENEDKYYYNPPSIPADLRPTYKKILFVIANRKLYYRYL
jgi:hypothetical protein